MSLIDRLVNALCDLSPSRLKRLVIVFPNRRAGLFLRHALSSAVTRPTWLPEVLSVEEAFSRWSGFANADRLTMVVEIIRQQLQEHAGNGFEAAAFVGYATQMASDFDDIDQSLTLAEELFGELNEAKALETWHPDGSPLSAYETAYLKFFQSLLPTYHLLKERLSGYGMLWSGAMAAMLAKLEDEEWTKRLADHEIWFAGFGALTRAEEKIMTTLCRIGKARMWWDLDEYYLLCNDQIPQQAGFHVRKFMEKHPGLMQHWISNKLATQPKKITVVAANGAVAQAKALGTLLGKQKPVGYGPAEAIVLADEKMLEPVLNSIPSTIKDLNITMGYPLFISPLYQLAEKLLNFAVYPIQSDEGAIPLMLLLDILQSPVLQNAPDKKISHALQYLVSSMLTEGSQYLYVYKLSDYQAQLPEIARELIIELTKLRYKSAASLPVAVVEWLYKAGLDSSEHELFREQFGELTRLFHRLSQTISKAGLETLRALPILCRQLAQQARIRLKGEPLKGMQLMGMLETRNITFKRVHLLSANEGILPPAHQHLSLIPADLRRKFNLPLRLEKDAISAFHFYQLLQNTDELICYYNTEPDALGGGELSRFLMQINHELRAINPDIEWNEFSFATPLPSSSGSLHIEIPKNEKILNAIRQKAASGFSPSALTRWFNCNLQFYLADILHIREKNYPGDLPGYNVIGTIIHAAIEKLYKPLVDRPLTINDIENLRQKVDAAVRTAFKEEFPGAELTQGRNALHFALIKAMVTRALNADIQRLAEGHAITLLKQEQHLSVSLQSSETTILLKGYPDRIDTDGHYVNILDYKSGKLNDNELNLSNWDDLRLPKKKYAFQLAFYMLMAKKSNQYPPGAKFRGFIVPLRRTQAKPFEFRLPSTESDALTMFEDFLLSAFDEMLDPLTPITQTNEHSRCKFCPYIGLCNRESLTD